MRIKARGILFGLLALTVACSIASAQRARFSGPPVAEDRKITFQWEPVAGRDPYFQGNTVLDPLGTVSGPASGRPLRILRAGRTGDLLYAVYEGDSRVHIWDPVSGLERMVLDAPPDSITDLEVHGTGELILGGLRDGRIALWTVDNGTAPEIFLAHPARVRKVRFLGQGLDPSERSFVSAAAEDTIRIWAEPGNLLTKLTVPGNPTTSLDVTSDGATIVAGDGSGALRIFKLLQGSWRIDRRLDGHVASVAQVLFNRNRNRLFSIDASGLLIGWDTITWAQNFVIQLDRPESALLGVRDPDGSLVYTLDRDGFFQIFDGGEGRVYRTGDLREGSGSRIHASAFGNGGRLLFVGLEDGSVRRFRTGFCEPSETNKTCFGGYMLWRSPTPDPEDAVQLRVFGFGDSTWSFVGSQRRFTDPDSLIPRGEEDPENALLAGPHNGMPFYYSITDFNRVYLNGSISDVGWDLQSIEDGFFRADPAGPPSPVQAHSPARTSEDGALLGNVYVVPNPYEAGRVPWDSQIGEHVDFVGLPERATIRLYSTAGDHLRTIEHAAGAFGESSNREAWDLRNHRGEKVASGVYIYHITTPLSAEETKGYFIVVR